MNTQSRKIQVLNDRFRQGDRSVSGTVLCTGGVSDLVSGDTLLLAELFGLVRRYDTFNVDNDPYHEHDFGTFEFRGEKCFWKIDVLDPSLEMAPLDPSDPTLSTRVLTVMLAGEY